MTLDVIPYTIVIGHRGELAGLNRVGLRRGGISAEQIHGIYRAYKALFFGPGTLVERAKAVGEAHADDPLVVRIVEFIRSGKARRLTTPRRSGEREE